MAITIGRVGASPTLDDPQSIEFDGERLRFTGLHRASTVANALVLRDQLRGLGGNVDEPVVPIFFTDSTYDILEGLYRIDGVQARLNETDAALGDVSWQLQATRVANYQSPVCESRLVMAKISNAHSVSSAIRHEIGLPYLTSEVYPQGLTDGSGILSTGDGGSITYLHYYPPGSASNPFETSGVGALQWTTTLANWYSGGCKITVNGQTVVGRQSVDTPTSWQITNGLVRVSASATAGAWDIEWWDGSAWDTAKVFLPFSYVGNNADGFWHIGVLRNGPEAATIRLGLSNPSGITCNVDLTIRRGTRWVTVVFSGTSAQWGVRRSSAEASTGITGGIRATSNDASGNRFILASPAAFTQDTANAAIWLTTAASRAIFGIGCEVGGSGAVSPFTAAAQVSRFFGPVHETVRVVGR